MVSLNYVPVRQAGAVLQGKDYLTDGLLLELFDGNDELPEIGGVLEDKCDMKNSDIVLRVRSLDECAFGRT